MNKAILILLFGLLFISPSNQKPLIHNGLDYEFSPFIYRAGDLLQIHDCSIYIFRTTANLEAFSVKGTDNKYFIFVNTALFEWSNTRLVLAHELVHISDDIHGRWLLTKPTTIIGNGYRKYVSKEAQELERSVERRSKEIYKILKNI